MVRRWPLGSAQFTRSYLRLHQPTWRSTSPGTSLLKRSGVGRLVKIAITERALKLRLRPALEAQGKHLRIATWQKQRKLGLGRFYVADANGVIDPDVDLEELATELGVMRSWETLKSKRR